LYLVILTRPMQWRCQEIIFAGGGATVKW